MTEASASYSYYTSKTKYISFSLQKWCKSIGHESLIMATKRPADDQGSGSGEPPVKKHATLQPVNIGTVGNLVNNDVNNNRALLLGAVMFVW